jgi:hypothetical protein
MPRTYTRSTTPREEIAVQRWEYRIEEIPGGPHQGQLRTWGGDGWELVSEIVIGERSGLPLVRSVLKRPRD